jgi:hypothetical protein
MTRMGSQNYHFATLCRTTRQVVERRSNIHTTTVDDATNDRTPIRRDSGGALGPDAAQ